jgi:hypothetical protein
LFEFVYYATFLTISQGIVYFCFCVWFIYTQSIELKVRKLFKCLRINALVLSILAFEHGEEKTHQKNEI